jgi:hypothetical protein
MATGGVKVDDVYIVQHSLEAAILENNSLNNLTAHGLYAIVREKCII